MCGVSYSVSGMEAKSQPPNSSCHAVCVGDDVTCMCSIMFDISMTEDALPERRLYRRNEARVSYSVSRGRKSHMSSYKFCGSLV